MFRRQLGRSGIQVSAMGMGCWAIGGPWSLDGVPSGWGLVDDQESIRAIHCALDLGIDFFDTAANYGCGHSERILGRALAGRRDHVIVATKFGYLVNEDNKTVSRNDTAVLANIRQDCEASLRRLNTDYIDLYHFHVSDYDPVQAAEVREALEELAAAGKIRFYGWSTDVPQAAQVFAQGQHCVAIQHDLNVIQDAPEMLAVCDAFDQASINRSPLGRGLLSGKYNLASRFPANDVRYQDSFRHRWAVPILGQLDALRQVLTSDGRTLVQGALAWIWARSERTIPIPGFKTETQVEENIQAIEFGPLTGEQMALIKQLEA
jgi:aryl-alcohol dehydrogenase-like predicted oxidoreductase